MLPVLCKIVYNPCFRGRNLPRRSYLRRDDASSECATARKHNVAEVACCRLERTLMGCTASPQKGRRGVGAPHQCCRANKNTKRMAFFFFWSRTTFSFENEVRVALFTSVSLIAWLMCSSTSPCSIPSFVAKFSTPEFCVKFCLKMRKKVRLQKNEIFFQTTTF